MTRLTLAALLLALPAHADTSHRISHSTVTLAATTAPGAVAEVTFNNSRKDSGTTEGFALDLAGFRIGLIATVGNGASPDSLTIIPPVGFFAHPEHLEISDGATATALIYPENSVGM